MRIIQQPSQSKHLGRNFLLIVCSLCSYFLCTSSCEWMHFHFGFTFRSPDKKSFLTVTGEWNGLMYAKYADKEVNLQFSEVLICWISFSFPTFLLKLEIDDLRQLELKCLCIFDDEIEEHDREVHTPWKIRSINDSVTFLTRNLSFLSIL